MLGAKSFQPELVFSLGLSIAAAGEHMHERIGHAL
jgi:hypothetical protein